MDGTIKTFFVCSKGTYRKIKKLTGRKLEPYFVRSCMEDMPFGFGLTSTELGAINLMIVSANVMGYPANFVRKALKYKEGRGLPIFVLVENDADKKAFKNKDGSTPTNITFIYNKGICEKKPGAVKILNSVVPKSAEVGGGGSRDLNEIYGRWKPPKNAFGFDDFPPRHQYDNTPRAHSPSYFSE